jgi:hypothetical protein
VPAFLAAIWLLGLFAAAPALRTSDRYDFPDRLRDALILGVAIPFGLGFVHAFYPLACWVALALCVAVAYARRVLARGGRARTGAMPVPYALIGALVAVAWPQLMRPLLDGDSLSYHLPNAASWVQAHSIWATVTRYWWYPPASECFAAALYAVSGPFALPWSGFAVLALLGFRIAAWAREFAGAPPLLADVLAAATVTAYPLAIQGGTLQNDVWLAAFWLESLWVLRSAPSSAVAMRTLAVTALIKPQGWILAAIALAARKAPPRVWLATAGALAIWLLHDAILWKNAIVTPASTMPANVIGSTILAHSAAALAILARVGFALSPFALFALLLALFGPLVATRDRGLGWAACAAALLFFALPFGYATSVAQLATGASLRFAAPAIAAGAVLLAYPARRAVAIATVLLGGSALFGIASVLAIFWNDGATHVAVAFALLAVAVAALARSARVAWPNAIAFAFAVVATVHLASRHPLDYYIDSLRVGTNAPGVYRWIATARPASIGGWGLRLGVVNVLSPLTRTLDLSDEGACAQAARERVLLVAVAQNDRPVEVNAQRLSAARLCGSVRYADAIGVVTEP